MARCASSRCATNVSMAAICSGVSDMADSQGPRTGTENDALPLRALCNHASAKCAMWAIRATPISLLFEGDEARKLQCIGLTMQLAHTMLNTLV